MPSELDERETDTMQTTSTTPDTKPATSSTWTIDSSHTAAHFSVRHLMISNVRGDFQKVTGKVTFDAKNPQASKIEANIEVASINTREPARDTHLKSGDFFDAEKYPSIIFESKSFSKTSDGFEVKGDLTIKETTKEVVLKVEGPTAEQKDPWGNTRIGASAKTSIKRSDFGMTWNAALEAGGVVVGDEIKIELDVELIQAK